MRPGPYSESPADELAALRGAITTYLDARDEARPLDEADARRRLDALLGRTARAYPVILDGVPAAAPRSPRGVAILPPSAARRFGLGGGFGTSGEG